jgi:hypothetical protein
MPMSERVLSNNASSISIPSLRRKSLPLPNIPFCTSNERYPFQRRDGSGLHALLADPWAALSSIHSNTSTALLTWRGTPAVRRM